MTIDYSQGCNLPPDQWVDLNRNLAFTEPGLAQFIAPFPPRELMQVTTGLVDDRVFAGHGADFWTALSAASPRPLSSFESVLDFGCGCGRLARMFKGTRGRLSGCDIDHRHVEWCDSALDYMDARLSKVHPPIPFGDDSFDAIISISIFTHLTEASQDEFLAELARVCRPDGLLFLTIHGERALERGLAEPAVRAMLDVPEAAFKRAQDAFAHGRHGFVLQAEGHLTTIAEDGLRTDRVISEPFEYGITFLPASYIRSHWTRWFELVDHRSGAIHDFQDILVLRPRK